MTLSAETLHITVLQPFVRVYDVAVDGGITLHGKMEHILQQEENGDWNYTASISVWGLNAVERSIFAVNDQGFVPRYYSQKAPFRDQTEKHFNDQRNGYDRLNILLRFEADFIADPERNSWEYAVLGRKRSYRLEWLKDEMIALGEGNKVNCRVFEMHHGSKNAIRTRFWMDKDTGRIIRIDHREPGYQYSAILNI